MRNVTILLAAVAVLAMAVPANGALVEWYPDGRTGNWHASPTNWVDYSTTTPHAIPASGDTAYIRTGGTAQVTQLVANNIKLNMGWGSPGHLEMKADAARFEAATYLYIGFRTVAGSGTSTFSQSHGLVESREILVGEQGGSGIYTITGGRIEQISDHVSFIMEVGDTGTGRFNVVGTAPAAIIVAKYVQNSLSTLGITLDSTGVRVITVYNDATLAGTLVFDATSYTGTATVIDILQAGSDGTGTLSYSGLSLDAASTAAGYTLGDDGNGMLQVTIPEPATMALLGLGGIGVLIRRKRQ